MVRGGARVGRKLADNAEWRKVNGTLNFQREFGIGHAATRAIDEMALELPLRP
ncbi:hypothetical protein [Nocardia pseudovaccinii]|uniref:hypothetical protein n=1 Tax=Nocardia pseudovaccinii TaxID=189540 RepID=UPI000ACEE4FE|nr:hypothetical protein [Nocardia pseudovaccinii]